MSKYKRNEEMVELVDRLEVAFNGRNDSFAYRLVPQHDLRRAIEALKKIAEPVQPDE